MSLTPDHTETSVIERQSRPVCSLLSTARAGRGAHTSSLLPVDLEIIRNGSEPALPLLTYIYTRIDPTERQKKDPTNIYRLPKARCGLWKQCGNWENPPFASSSVRITATKRSPRSLRFVKRTAGLFASCSFRIPGHSEFPPLVSL